MHTVMHDIDIAAIDLNLLVNLDVLLETQSVSRAAERLGIGQPAASHALARLRGIFDDPLLVRSGRGMSPTPRAEALREPLRRWLEAGSALVSDAGRDDPATTRRSFVVHAPDLLAPALPSIAVAVAAVAPQARLEVTSRRPDDDQALAEGRVDMVLGPSRETGGGLIRRGLGEVRFAVVTRRGHPGLGRSGRLGKSAWSRYPHVLVKTGHGGSSIVARALEAQGGTRRIGLVVPSFLAALTTVAATDNLFTVPGELVEPLLEPLTLSRSKPPVPLPSVSVEALWSERVQADPVHRSLRHAVISAVEASLDRARRSVAE